MGFAGGVTHVLIQSRPGFRSTGSPIVPDEIP